MRARRGTAGRMLCFCSSILRIRERYCFVGLTTEKLNKRSACMAWGVAGGMIRNHLVDCETQQILNTINECFDTSFILVKAISTRF
jgi:hypothetical protein